VPIRSPLAALRRGVQRLGGSTRRHQELAASLDEMRARIDALAAESRTAAATQMEVLRAIFENEPANRLRLWELREQPDYMASFQEEEPLVSVCVPTYSNAEALAERCLPSILAQTYRNIEVVIVGDAATPEVEDAVRSFDDPRIRFSNLTIRGPYPSDPLQFWFVAGTGPGNECLRLARGRWIAHNSDDDVFTPDHVEVLLQAARERHLEFVYGRIRSLDPQGEGVILGTFPPEAPGHFGVQGSLLHRCLRLFPHELLVFDNPGDWAWLRRMIRLGVRIGMIDDIVVDYFPSQLWGTPARPAGLVSSHDWGSGQP
jgi:hypothetical protein